MAIPGAIIGLGYTFTTTSLDFTWDVASDADGYIATLYRDGNQVEQQDVATEAASFTGLEDGTAYTLDLYAYNGEGDGPTTTYEATTGYVVPSPPTNLRQFEERIIAVICRWDLVEPDKTFDVQLQLLYGNELLFDEVIEPEQTERTFNVPMASTDYLLRVRAGNPAGWSDWAEGTVSTEVFPLIDSRLGVMAATYQEDALYTDTWDGAADGAKGVVESLGAEAEVTVGAYGLEQTYFPPKPRVVKSDKAHSSGVVESSFSLAVSERSIKKNKHLLDTGSVGYFVAVSAQERSIKINTYPESKGQIAPAIVVSASTKQVKFSTQQKSAGTVSPSVSVSVQETLQGG